MVEINELLNENKQKIKIYTPIPLGPIIQITIELSETVSVTVILINGKTFDLFNLSRETTIQDIKKSLKKMPSYLSRLFSSSDSS
jgi:hypothetical protein